MPSVDPDLLVFYYYMRRKGDLGVLGWDRLLPVELVVDCSKEQLRVFGPYATRRQGRVGVTIKFTDPRAVDGVGTISIKPPALDGKMEKRIHQAVRDWWARWEAFLRAQDTRALLPQSL